MSEISFKSTFRIPVTQAGVNKAKKLKLKSLLNSYPNSLIGTGNTGYARVSMSNSEDAKFIMKLKEIKYKVFQKFDVENLKKTEIDEYIKEKIATGEYTQIGKQKAAAKQRPIARSGRKNEEEAISNVKKKKKVYQGFKLDINNGQHVQQKNPNEVRKAVYVNDVSIEEQELIRQTADYKRFEEKYGREFADAICFFKKKKI